MVAIPSLDKTIVRYLLFLVILATSSSSSRAQSWTIRERPLRPSLNRILQATCPLGSVHLRNITTLSNVTLLNEYSFAGNRAVCGHLRINNARFLNGFEETSLVMGSMSLQNVMVLGPTNFSNAIFPGGLQVHRSRFKGETSFDRTYIGYLEIIDTRFDGSVSFNQTEFGERIKLLNATFADGIDWRYADMRSVNEIVLGNTNVLPGRFLTRWDQLSTSAEFYEKHKRFKLQLTVPPYVDVTMQEMSPRYEDLYIALVSSYQSQGRDDYVDGVKYELAWRKDVVAGSRMDHLYGLVYGYGFQPWRFITFLILPLNLSAAFLLWILHYPTVCRILNPDLLRTVTIQKLALGYSISSPTMTTLTSVVIVAYQCVYLSFSVFFSLRFNPHWLVDEDPGSASNSGISLSRQTPPFPLVIGGHFILGYVALISFILLGRGSVFASIRLLFGL